MTIGPLTGVTILELGQVIAGTFGGVILADLGAEVIKIEPPSGDTARNPNIAPLGDESSIHLFMNRGKKSVVIDLKNPEGLEVFYSLVANADVVLDNFRPGVMERLGIDHATLASHNPDIITVSVTGFGEYGPARDKAAFDLVVQAYSGHVDITGPDDGPPARVGIPLADLGGAIYSCISVLAGLVGRGSPWRRHPRRCRHARLPCLLAFLRRSRLPEQRSTTDQTWDGPRPHRALAGVRHQ